MNFKNLYKILIVGGCLTAGMVTFNACKKGEKYASSDGAGKTIVKLKDAEKSINVFARDVTPTIETFGLIDIRRDAHSSASLNQALSVTVSVDQAALDAYNDDNGTSFEMLPEDAYTLSENISNLTFQPGEHGKYIKITLDKDKMDLSKQYALALTISAVGTGASISSSMSQAVYSIGLKNKYDGVYTLNGKFYHPTQSPGYDAFSLDVEMQTSGPSSVKIYWPGNGFYHPGLFAGVLNAFGAQEPEYTIDETTNKVTVQNSYVGAVTFYTMAPGYDSHYDPATKTIYAKFGYNYAAGPTFDPANNREWTDVLVYKGPR